MRFQDGLWWSENKYDCGKELPRNLIGRSEGIYFTVELRVT